MIRPPQVVDAVQHSEVDAIVVGLGWAGGIVASELCKAGMKVVGLERGPDPDITGPAYTRTHDEIRYGVLGELAQDTSKETWTLRHDPHESAFPIRNLGSFRPGSQVGGSGVAWGGAVWRLLPSDFETLSNTVTRYGKASLPERCSIQDWGITYDELEPFYDRFEAVIGASGIAGN